MSINVTVTGNPVSIKHGKMVTFDPNAEKKEFEKRRLIRLEQVRQQSKELAQDVRNKVQKEKTKQKGKIENEGKQKLKNWQNRKLLELQNQYIEALNEIGMGHKEAEQVQIEDEILNEQKEKNDMTAMQRGKAALTKLQVDKNKENYKTALPIQHKKLVRDVENVRASLVSKIKKNPRRMPNENGKKKADKSTDINITIPDNSDKDSYSNTGSDSPDSNKASDSDSSTYCECGDEESTTSEDMQKGFKPEDILERVSSTSDAANKVTHISSDEIMISSKSSDESTFQNHYRQSIEERRKLIENLKNKNKTPYDSRISDRIKKRQEVAAQPDFCDLNLKTHFSTCQDKRDSENYERPRKKQQDFQHSVTRDYSNSEECICKRPSVTCCCKCNCHSKLRENKSVSVQATALLPSEEKSTDIPSIPVVKLKDVVKESKSSSIDKTKSTTDSQRIRYYDHSNKFSGQRASASRVEKITADSIECIPNVVSEAEWQEKLKQRDREAQIRGKIALDKEHVRRDYEDLMKKLPLLQRKEHIAEIGTDKPEYHMSEERLKELEKKRQVRLENAYVKAFPDLKPAIVTIPKSKPTAPTFEIIDPDDSRTLNLGKWESDIESRKMFSANEVKEIISSFAEQKDEDRQAKLKQLLKTMKLQKEQLLNEIRSLPLNESVKALIDDLNSFNDGDDAQKTKSRKKPKPESDRKRKHDSDSTSESNTTSENLEKKRSSHKMLHSKKYAKVTPKKMKESRPKVLVLQNMSTQTTPKSKKDTPRPDEPTAISPQPQKICLKTHTPCDCDKENRKKKSEELCQILIKLNDDEEPNVEVVKTGTEKPIFPAQEGPSTQKSIDTKSVATETERVEQPKKVKMSTDSSSKSKKRAEEKVEKRKHTSKKTESWKQQLSRNSISTSSTSYFSPPDFSKPNGTVSTEVSKSSLYNLRKKPQQKNIHSLSGLSFENQKIPPRLLNYIERLLNMSKLSVEDLGMSSSDIQTPSQSVIEMESNNPLAPLHSIIKHLNLKMEDIANDISTSNVSHGPPNSLANTGSLQGETADISQIPEKDTNSSSKKSRDSLLCQYANITDSCSKRIANLASMIEKLREEKLRLLRSPPEVRQPEASTIPGEYSTAYMDLPATSERSKDSGKSSTSTSIDEQELNRRLLEIDLSLADKLKDYARTKGQVGPWKTSDEGVNVQLPPPSVDQPDDIHQEFQDRFRRLMERSIEEQQPLDRIIPVQQDEESFVPLLLDIPKLPILEPQADYSVDNQKHRHPPPSKGLIVAKRFNGNISVIPHELSTIVEADSQVSTKIPSPKVSPDASEVGNDNTEEAPLPLEPPQVKKLSIERSEERSSASDKSSKKKVVIVATKDISTSSVKSSSHKSTPTQTSDSSRSLSCTDATCSALTSSSSRLSSSSDGLKSLEDILKSMGMDWAIPTLHKTQAALELTSSSSSLEMDSKRKKRVSSSSEVSLKDFLTKQLARKVSSSSLKSDTSPASFLQEFSDLSAIQPSSSLEKGKQRTSTPVGTSKSPSKSNESDKNTLFTGVSDISSVKNGSSHVKQTFKSLADEPSSSSQSTSDL